MDLLHAKLVLPNSSDSLISSRCHFENYNFVFLIIGIIVSPKSELLPVCRLIVILVSQIGDSYIATDYCLWSIFILENGDFMSTRQREACNPRSIVKDL